MKIKKKILIYIIALSILTSGCSMILNKIEPDIEDIETATEEIKEVEDTTSQENDIVTCDDVDAAYEYYLMQIMNNEKIQQLDGMTFDSVLYFASRASQIASAANTNDNRIETINKLVSIDDLSHNTSEDVMTECILYMINEYETNGLQDPDKSSEYQYVARYLDKMLAQYPEMEQAHSMVFDMYQIIRDHSRNDEHSVNENTKQVNKVIANVKNTLLAQ